MDRGTDSLWLAAAPPTGFPSLTGETGADVVIAGGGISGVLAAAQLAGGGRSVVVLESAEIGAGVTGHTTGKVSSLQGTIYSRLKNNFGADGAALYAQANESGRQLIADLIAERAIDCGWESRDAWTYAADADDVPALEEEFAATAAAGLPVERAVPEELPFRTEMAIRLAGQAQIDAARFVRGLAKSLVDDPKLDVRFFEHSRVHAIRERSTEAALRTESGTVIADHAIVASHFPFADRGLFFARLEPQRSYCIACESDSIPQGMYISAGSPTRSLRSATTPDGRELLIVGGEGHRTGSADESGRYETLARFAAQHFGAGAPLYRWSSQDNKTLDGAPYVGALWQGSSRLSVVTGFGKWGLANAAASALILSERVEGRVHPWQRVFDSARLKPVAGATEFVRHNALTGWHLVKDHVLHPRAPSCTHLGCKLHWNTVERSWDCPCHGSRFDERGTVLHGPAVDDLSDPPPQP